MRLYDTLSRETRELQPVDGERFRFYCCGPTVYGPAHIGNFRTFVLQDVLRRALEIGGLETLHVRNITDVDDRRSAIRRPPGSRSRISPGAGRTGSMPTPRRSVCCRRMSNPVPWPTSPSRSK
jgi:hypothetical protein